MKSILKNILETPLSFLERVTFIAALVGALAATNLPAADDSGNAPKPTGASVIVSAPLAQGNSLGGNEITVVDLGQAYTLKTLQLKFAGSGTVKVYVVKTKPSGEGDWVTLAGALTPNAVFQAGATPTLPKPAKGEYLVIITDSGVTGLSGLQFAGANSVGTTVFVDAAISQTGDSSFSTTTTTTLGTGPDATSTSITVASNTSPSGSDRFGHFGSYQGFEGGSLGESPGLGGNSGHGTNPGSNPQSN